MEKPPLSFFAMSFILIFALISFIFIVFGLRRIAFVLGLAMLLLLSTFLSFGMLAVYNSKKWGWTLVGAALMALMLNVFLAYALTSDFGTEHLTALLFSATGAILCLFNLRVSFKKSHEAGMKEKEYYPFIDKMEPEEKSE